MKDFTIRSNDGRSIPATLFPGDRSEPREVVVVAPATATPQRFYRGFAEYAASLGRDVVTFDYRGIARDRPARLRGFQASYLDWAQNDLGAVVDWAAQFGPVDLIGHSYGGQALGHLPNHAKVRSLATFGTGAGHHSYMVRDEQIRVLALWKLIGPVATTLYGYLPGRMLGLGEDLPLGVYRDWRHWCGFPRYWFDDPRVDFAPRFAAVKSRVLSITAEDDRWAPHESADVFMSHYTGATVETKRVEAGELGLRSIGHMGFFRRDNGPALWPVISRWWETIGAMPSELPASARA